MITAAQTRLDGLGVRGGPLAVPSSSPAPPVLGQMTPGVTFTEAAGRNNHVILPSDCAGMDLRVAMRGHNNLLVVESGANLRHQSRITMEGGDGLCVIRAGAGSSKVNLTLRGPGATLVWGKDCTANDVTALAYGTHVIFGDDCLMSWGIYVRSYDSHAIIDLSTGAQINSPRPVVIGPRVWIAQDCLIMPGVEIGRGSIVGARSLVTKSVPERSLAAGSPARILREGVTWDRDAAPNAEKIRSAVERAI